MKLNKFISTAFLPFFTLILFFVSCIILKVYPTRLIGAAFCHQIPSRSPAYNFPFCYRCCGLFFGILFGYITALLKRRNILIIPKTDIIFFFLSLFVFCTDILNSSKIPEIHIYKESIELRMISSFPLGFFLSEIVCIFLDFWDLLPKCLNKKTSRTLPYFLVGGLLSFYLTFNKNYFISLFSRILISTGTVIFVSSLYILLIFSIKSLKNKIIPIKTIINVGISLAILQITLFGYLHLRYIHFEHFFS